MRGVYNLVLGGYALIGLVAGTLTGITVKHMLPPLPEPITFMVFLFITGLELLATYVSVRRICAKYDIKIYQAPLWTNFLFFICACTWTYF